MSKNIYIFGFILIMLAWNINKVYAIERVVIMSITVNDPDKWNENIYLIADKDGADYKNFTVQVGDFGRGLYNFPKWINYSYDPKLFKVDLNGDKLEDIVIVLVTGAGSGVSEKGIHVLHQGYAGFYDFHEVPVESINESVKRLVKMEKQGDIVTINTGNKKYKIDIAKFNYDNPGEPYANTSNFDYYIKNNKLFGSIGVGLTGSHGAIIGGFDIEYFWDGRMYKAKSIVFR